MTATPTYVKVRKQRSGSIASLSTIHRTDCKRIAVLATRLTVNDRDLSPLNSPSFCGVCMKPEKAAANQR